MRQLFLILGLVLIVPASLLNAQPTLNTESQKQLVMSNLSAMPLSFTENRGQWDSKVLFKAEAGGATFWFCKGEVVYQFARDTDELEDISVGTRHAVSANMPDKFNHPRYKKESMVLSAQFVGANPDAEIIGEDRSSYKCGYIIGNDPSKWRTDIPNYSSITYKNIYPGIDLKYYGNGHGMKYDFIVSPGADISQIKIRYDGVNNLAITSNGDLQADTRFGQIYENIPAVYQELNGSKRNIAGQYRIIEPGVFGFEVEDYNPNLPLIIDPELVYSTYLGGDNYDYGCGIAINGTTAWVTGSTSSTNFPTVGLGGALTGSSDAFVTKLSSTGNTLMYSIYLGGNGQEIGLSVADNGSGAAYVTGWTNSSDFPTTNVYDDSYNGGTDGFVVKLRVAGQLILYGTYLGGNSYDCGNSIDVDGSGSAYVTGYTLSADFPVVNSYDGSYNGGADVFVSKFSPDGSSLAYSTYLGGDSEDKGRGIALDGSGSAYVTGNSYSSNFPTLNPYQTYQGGIDAFVAKLSPSGNSLVYSTFLGGNSSDVGYSIAVDGSGNAYVTGQTTSINFPTQNPYQQTLRGASAGDAFATKLSPSGNSLVYSTYLGGNVADAGFGIAIDGSGNAYVTGWTSSTDFPLLDPFQTDQPSDDAFVTKLSASGNSLVYSTYLGGENVEIARGIAVDANGNAYITGYTGSGNFPTQNPYQTYQGPADYTDAFVTKLGSICNYIPGDANGNGAFNGLDVTYSVNYFRGAGNPPPYTCECHPGNSWFVAGDVNNSCSFNGLDVTYMVNYFKGGAAPIPCGDCPPGR